MIQQEGKTQTYQPLVGLYTGILDHFELMIHNPRPSYHATRQYAGRRDVGREMLASAELHHRITVTG